jgi:hypothetical protein
MLNNIVIILVSPLWSMQMWDAWGQRPSGILRDFQVLMYGGYNECMRTIDPQHNTTMEYCAIQTVTFEQFITNTQYILSDIIPMPRIQVCVKQIIQKDYHYLQYGLCVPSICTHSDIRQILKTTTNQITNKLTITNFIDNVRVRCEKDNKL